MGQAGARRARERFSWQRTAEETVALYEEVLDGSRAARARARSREPAPAPSS
jgi:hypothetical protein